jgi:hypothetical protein
MGQELTVLTIRWSGSLERIADVRPVESDARNGTPALIFQIAIHQFVIVV